MTGLRDLRWVQLHSVPRPPEGLSEDPVPSQLVAAVTACHAELLTEQDDTAAFAVAWLRVPGESRLRFLVGAQPALPLQGQGALGAPGQVSVLYPPGATGVPLGSGQVGDLVDALPYWVRCLGQPDVLLTAEREREQGRRPRAAGGSFDDYAAHLGAPFAWVVLAEPLRRDVLEQERMRLATRIPAMRKRENAEADRLELERAQARYRELTRARASGIWNVSVLVGGATSGGVARAASLLCAAAQAEDLPYGLLPGDKPAPVDAVLAAPVVDPQDGQSPFAAPAELVAALARPPARELPGIRLVTPHRFDVTPEGPDEGLPLGHVVDAAYTAAGTLRVSTDTLNRHGFVCGATGSGKSQTTRSVLEHLTTAAEPTPWLVVEPAKAEYAGMSGRLGPDHEVLVIRPGEPDAPPASINPLEPEPGFPLQSHADLVRALFLAAFEANEPFPQVLSRAVTECYRDAGWDLVTSTPRPANKPKFFVDEPDEQLRPRYPTLGDLQTTAQRVVESIGYGKEVAADVRGFVDVRIGSLREGRPGRFFEGGHPLDIEGLLAGNVVLELESLTNDQDKAFLMGAVLIRIVEHLRVKCGDTGAPGLQHVTVIEEAHRLLKNVHDGPAAAAVELFASLLAEIRAYGEGVLVVEQIPSKILPDVLKNTALKVMHRLPAADDRQAVGATMNLQDEQSEAVVAFPPGVAAVTVDGADRPFLVRMSPGDGRESAHDCSTYPPMSGRRSQLCGTDCLGRACTLREINGAQHASLEPPVVVWIEAVAASLITGFAPPEPRAGVRAALPTARRDLDCALATAVDRAVVARRSWLRGVIDTNDFAAQLRTVLGELLEGETPAYERARWRTGAYRWSGPRFDLRTAVETAGGREQAQSTPPHPDTAEWARRGLVLDAPTLAGQFDQLVHHPSYADGQEFAALGDTAVSGLRAAVAALTGAATAAGFGRAVHAACADGQVEDLVGLCADMLVPAEPVTVVG